uniref:Photosystem II reaction center protein Z n=1 Tax=Cyanophora paradoxa TaxID=2762 RepID=A0A097PBA7_CYAPA|nr:hypothetical protein [Cyanophora paradoxa]
MLIAFQGAVAALVLLSFVLIVAVPVALASPGEWERSQRLIYAGAALWTSLIVVIGVLDSIVAKA